MKGELALGERAEYRLDLGTGTYARLRVAPQPLEGAENEGVAGEVTVRILAPGDRPLLAAVGVRDEPSGLMAWVGEAAGRYRIEIENTDPLGATAYQVEVEEARPARPGDLHRAAAESARAEAERLAVAADREQVLAALGRSLEQWRLAGETDAAVGVLIDMVAFDWGADPEAALARCEEALGLSIAAGLAPREIDALNLKGMILRRRGDCSGALAAYEQARTSARKHDDLERSVLVEFNIAVLQRHCAPDLAPAAFEDAIGVAKKAGDTASEAFARRELSMLASRQGNLIAARDQMERAWSLARRSGDRSAQAAVSHAMGNLNRQLGRLAEAREDYQRCLEFNEALGRREHLPEILLSLGILALELRRPEEAWLYDERALRIAESLGDVGNQSDALVELGAVLHRQGDYVGAEGSFRRALATAERLAGGPARERRLAAARYRVGFALLAQDRPREAVDVLARALEAQRTIGDRIGEVQTAQVLGTAHGRLGDRGAAVEHLSSALTLNRELGDPLRTVDILYRMAEVQAEEDQAQARRTLEEAIAIGQRVRAGLSADTLRARFSEGSRRLYELYVEILVRSGDWAAAFVASENGRARALLDLLADARVDVATGVAPGLQKELAELDARITWLQKELRAAPGGDERRSAALRTELERAEQQWWRVEAAIRGRSPKYQELRSPTIARFGEVRGSLPARGALLEYWIGDEGAYVFVLTQRSFTLKTLPPAREIEARVSALRSSVLALEPAARYAPKAFELYRVLVAPALDAARSSGEPIDELVIVPDGPLHLLPFESLVTAAPEAGARFEDLAYLLRQASISYAPSATVLASLGHGRTAAEVAGEDRTPSGIRLLAFADPRYDRPLALDCPEAGGSAHERASSSAPMRSHKLEGLVGAREEVRAIVDLYGSQARVYYGEEASEQRIKTDPELAAAERVHLAVHGVLCESFPERSGLVFALDGGPEDGILQTREVFGLELTADLVVLSACQTGLGRVVSGEGVVGMARAFFYAGTPSLVVSLWQVSDLSTTQLMASFYRNLDSGNDKAAALRRAQLELIEAGGATAAPFYWAPFVLLGSRDSGRARSRG